MNLTDPQPLVSVDWLRAHLDDPRLVVADVRWAMRGPSGADAYAEGHIPGAHFVDLDRDLSSPPRADGGRRHPLPDAASFAAVLSRLGVTRQSILVGYDDRGGAIAARLWWMLRYFGLDHGRVLDGGIQAWQAAGGALEQQAPDATPSPLLSLQPRPELVVDMGEVDALRSRDDALLLDARSTDRYLGRTEPIDPRAGHIPGAHSAPCSGNLSAPGGTFLSREALAARYGALGLDGAATVATYCGSGVTACHNLLAMQLIGRTDAKLYVGSWSEWSGDPTRPAAGEHDTAD